MTQRKTPVIASQARAEIAGNGLRLSDWSDISEMMMRPSVIYVRITKKVTTRGSQNGITDISLFSGADSTQRAAT
jgi:hypothetical protein